MPEDRMICDYKEECEGAAYMMVNQPEQFDKWLKDQLSGNAPSAPLKKLITMLAKESEVMQCRTLN